VEKHARGPAPPARHPAQRQRRRRAPRPRAPGARPAPARGGRCGRGSAATLPRRGPAAPAAPRPGRPPRPAGAAVRLRPQPRTAPAEKGTGVGSPAATGSNYLDTAMTTLAMLLHMHQAAAASNEKGRLKDNRAGMPGAAVACSAQHPAVLGKVCPHECALCTMKVVVVNPVCDAALRASAPQVQLHRPTHTTSSMVASITAASSRARCAGLHSQRGGVFRRRLRSQAGIRHRRQRFRRSQRLHGRQGAQRAHGGRPHGRRGRHAGHGCGGRPAA